MDLTDLSSGEIIEDGATPPERPSSSPLQGSEIQNSRPTENTSEALDKLLASKNGDAAPKLDKDVEDPVAKAADEARVKAEAARKTKEETAAKQKNEASHKTKEEKAAAPVKSEAEKKAEAEATAKEEAAKAKANEPRDELSKVELPPYVKPATVTAFDKVKAVARETISKLEKTVAELTAKMPKEGGLTPELQKEFEELRNFRAVHNYRGTPEFLNTYQKPIDANDESILGTLKDAGFTAEQLAQIKGIGTGKLDWDPVLEKLPTIARREIEAALLENSNLSKKRDKALKDADSKPAEYAKQQAAETTRRTAEESALLKTTADTIIEQGELLKKKDIPVSATAEERATIEADNKFIDEQQQRYDAILADRSPGMIGQLVASTLLAYKFKAESAGYKARAESAETELAKIKKASQGRRESAAPSGGPAPKRETSILRDTGSALDVLRAEKEAARD